MFNLMEKETEDDRRKRCIYPLSMFTIRGNLVERRSTAGSGADADSILNAGELR